MNLKAKELKVEVFYEQVMKIYRGMTLEQKEVMLKRLGEAAKEDGLMTLAASFTKGGAVVKGGKKKKAWRARQPYWMKTFVSYNAAAKGADCIEGEFFFDVKNAVGILENFVVGTREEPKQYYICQRKDGSTSNITDRSGTSFEIKDTFVISSADSFRELRDLLGDL